jgi:hypothetical protein
VESIYFVLSWVCHRTCEHCYEDRFRPYYGAELERMIAASERDVPRIIDNFPSAITFLDPENPQAPPRPGRVIVAGGEVLLDRGRDRVLYPALQKLRARYGPELELIVQTTGDLVNRKHVTELLDLGVNIISISGMDPYHAGFEEEETRERLKQKLTTLFESLGMQPWAPPGERQLGPRLYHFFGATPDSWIGKLWPRGRAFANELSTATLEDNFCNGWSGGLNFLAHRYKGSEVSVDPEGNVYPCCLKTKLPIGNLLEEPLESILERHASNPVYQAISMGRPERMGLAYGWSEEAFREKSRMVLPSGRVYQNLCIGCDRFHDEVLSANGNLVQVRL